MSFHGGIGGSDPLRGERVSGLPGTYMQRRSTRTWRLGTGTLACPQCDAPVSLGGSIGLTTHTLHCPYCAHSGLLRDFLSLATPQHPARPAKVQIRIVPNGRRTLRVSDFVDP
jgi:hypothetical protein